MSTPTVERQPVWKHGVAAAVIASTATTALAAAASTAGVSFADNTGASIPLAGFAQLTLVFSLVGVGLAAVVARKARRPRRTFVRTTVALTVLSFVPDLTFGFDAGSAATLITLHIVAAAIVVPALAGRLARTR
jgi:amino acid transporter